MIKQQVLDVTISYANDHEEIANALSEVYKKNIDAVLADICDGLISPYEVVRIDSLTVDLGHLKFEKLATDFPKAVKNAVREALFKELKAQVISPVRARKAKSKNKEMGLFYYLETGLLPWYYEGNFENLRQEFSNKKIIDTEALHGMFRQPATRKRTVHFFEEEVLVAMLRDTLSIEDRKVLAQLKILRSCLDKLGSVQKRTKAIVISTTIKSLLETLSVKKEAYGIIMEQFLLRSGGESTEVIKSFFQLLPKEIRQKLQMVVDAIAWKKEKIFTAEEMELLHSFDTSFKTIAPEDTHFDNGKNEFKIDTNFEFEERLDVELGGIVIHNAGLILIWPYLEAFFTGLGLMKERSFTTPDSATKAVHLLHYLVFKSEEGDETEWLLNKIVCGIEPTEFVPEHFDLSLTEKEECDHLLNALIGNWPALKNTTSDSLRQTFLQRDGLLVLDENGWTLKVERKAFDVLLDRLTWAISVVKMPWNTFLIHTEW